MGAPLGHLEESFVNNDCCVFRLEKKKSTILNLKKKNKQNTKSHQEEKTEREEKRRLFGLLTISEIK